MSIAEINKEHLSPKVHEVSGHTGNCLAPARGPDHPCNNSREHGQEAEEGTHLQDCQQEGICKVKMGNIPSPLQEAENCPSQLYVPEIQAARCLRAQRTWHQKISKILQTKCRKGRKVTCSPALINTPDLRWFGYIRLVETFI